jgi:hypothetical protein
MVNEDSYLLGAWQYNNESPPEKIYPYLFKKRGATERTFDVSLSGRSNKYKGIPISEFIDGLASGRYPEAATVRMKQLNVPNTKGNGWLIRNLKLELSKQELEFNKTIDLDQNDPSIENLVSEFNTKIREADQLSISEVRVKGANYPRKPEKVKAVVTAYKRSPYVVIEVLRRANGVCESCGNLAPFKRQKDGTPYLEVHHKERLAMGGDDTVENVIALCPNCHREKHFGEGA